MPVLMKIVSYKIVLAADANAYGSLHGGINLKYSEEAGCIAARMYLDSVKADYSNPLLSSIETTDYFKSAYVGDMLEIKADVVFTSGHTLALNVVIINESSRDSDNIVSKSLLWYVNGEVDLSKRCVNFKKIPPYYVIDGKEYCRIEKIYEENNVEINRMLTRKSVISRKHDDTHPSAQVSANSDAYSHIFYAAECNKFDVVLGGCLGYQIDEVSSLAAYRHCKTKVLTIHIDSIVLHDFIFKNDICLFVPKIIFTSSRTIEIRVKVFRHNINEDETLVCSAYVTFVTVDENFKVIAVPPYHPETEKDKLRFAERRAKYELEKSKRKQ